MSKYMQYADSKFDVPSKDYPKNQIKVIFDLHFPYYGSVFKPECQRKLLKIESIHNVVIIYV